MWRGGQRSVDTCWNMTSALIMAATYRFPPSLEVTLPPSDRLVSGSDLTPLWSPCLWKWPYPLWSPCLWIETGERALHGVTAHPVYMSDPIGEIFCDTWGFLCTYFIFDIIILSYQGHKYVPTFFIIALQNCPVFFIMSLSGFHTTHFWPPFRMYFFNRRVSFITCTVRT
jgi:hypothetical protein